MKIKPKAAPELLPSQGSPGRASGAELGHPVGREGWGAPGLCSFGVPAPPVAPAHLVASFVDIGRGPLAQEVLGAPQVVGGALHVQREAQGSPRGPLPAEPQPLPLCAWQRSGKRRPRPLPWAASPAAPGQG